MPVRVPPRAPTPATVTATLDSRLETCGYEVHDDPLHYILIYIPRDNSPVSTLPRDRVPVNKGEVNVGGLPNPKSSCRHVAFDSRVANEQRDTVQVRQLLSYLSQASLESSTHNRALEPQKMQKVDGTGCVTERRLLASYRQTLIEAIDLA